MAALSTTLTSLNPAISSKKLSFRPKLSVPSPSRVFSVKATAATVDTYTVDYNSSFSVFPVEACQTIGGEACWAGMFPEAKLQQKQQTKTPCASETFDREYLEYNEPTTVFVEEACDDLGGEFCAV